MAQIVAVRTVAGRSARLLAICGKCGRKLGGGFGKGGGQSLTKLLRRELAAAKGKRAAVRIVETRCLKICPRHAVALVDGSRPDEILIVAQGTPAAIVAARLVLRLAD